MEHEGGEKLLVIIRSVNLLGITDRA